MDATMQLSEPTRLMLSRAVASSKRHGIKLTPGKLNPGLGNCAFEAVLHNINERACFEEKYRFSTDYYRRTSQAEQGHTRVPSSPTSNWTQSIQQSSNLLDLFY